MRPVRIAPFDTVVRRGAGGVGLHGVAAPARPVSARSSPSAWSTGPTRRRIARFSPSATRRGDVARGVDATARRCDRVRRLAQALLDRRLSPERPIVILSGNSIEHALLALAAMYAGVLYAPIAPAYSLQAREFATLRQIFERMQPGLVFAAEGAAFERALRDALPAGAELVVSASSPPAIVPSTPFAELERATPTPAVDDAHARVERRHHRQDPVHVGIDRPAQGRHQHAADALLEPGDDPRRRSCSCSDEPPVLCDWLPWNHTAGGNHNFGIVLYNGGTLYIDEGRPTPARFGATVRNLREIAVHGALHRAALLRDADAASAERRGAARDLLPRAEADLLRGGRTRPALLGRAARRVDRGLRRGAADHDRPRRDRDRAVRDLHRQPTARSPA